MSIELVSVVLAIFAGFIAYKLVRRGDRKSKPTGSGAAGGNAGGEPRVEQEQR